VPLRKTASSSPIKFSATTDRREIYYRPPGCPSEPLWSRRGSIRRIERFGLEAGREGPSACRCEQHDIGAKRFRIGDRQADNAELPEHSRGVGETFASMGRRCSTKHHHPRRRAHVIIVNGLHRRVPLSAHSAQWLGHRKLQGLPDRHARRQESNAEIPSTSSDDDL